MSEILIIVDGMADLPGHETDIYMPALHSIPVKEYVMTETRPDTVPSSERAIMSLLGYDISRLHISRPRLEAMALRLDTAGKNVFRVNITTPDGRPADITDAEAREIAMNAGSDFHAMDRYRMLLVSPEECPQLPDGLTLINSVQQLDRVAPLPTPTIFIGATHLIEGIAMHTGAKFIRPEGATGHTDTNIKTKTRTALNCLDHGYDRIVIHIEGTDEAAHMRDARLKADLLRQIDLYMIRQLLETGINLTVCADHITDAVTGCHHVGPVAIRSTK
ncbi:MAG: hypothetical protein K2M98_07970 [Muribaculum sp.]|nr:hypothetical protein [Muribaculum sp.]